MSTDKKKTETVDHRALWDELTPTPAKAKKQVNVGRSYTSIDPTWQIRRMTEVFGVCGKGWGYEASPPTFTTLSDGTVLVAISVGLWAESRDNVFGPVTGLEKVFYKTSKGAIKVETDAAKKAMTDALTKAMSHLGMSADVFLQNFVDTKTADDNHAHYGTQPATGDQRNEIDKLIAATAPDMEKLHEYFKVQSLDDLDNKQADNMIHLLNQKLQRKGKSDD